MVIDNETTNRAIESYIKDVRSAMNINSVFLFGSYAKDNFHEHSDIDLCFFLNDFEGRDSLETMKELFYMTHKYKGFDIQPTFFLT